MFEKLKTRNDRRSTFNDEILPAKFSRSPGASSSVTTGNEGRRRVRCKHCGWICDRERDIRSEDGSYTGYGIKYGDIQRTGAYVGDTDGQLSLNNTFASVSVTSTVTKTTSRASKYYSFDGDSELDLITGFTNSGTFSTISYASSAYQLMHNRVIDSIHASVASAPGVDKEIQVVVCVNDATTDMRAVITGTNTYAVSAAVAVSTGAYAPVKIQVNYDDGPTNSMISYSLVIEGSGEQTFHGPSNQFNGGVSGQIWALHGGFDGAGYNQSQPFIHFRTVQSGIWSNLRSLCDTIPLSGATTVDGINLITSDSTDFYINTGMRIVHNTVDISYVDSINTYTSNSGEWLAQQYTTSQASRQAFTDIITQIEFTPTNSKNFQYCFANQNIGQKNNDFSYGYLVGVGGASMVTSANISNGTYPEPFTLIPMNGTIKGMTIELNQATASAYTYTFRKNFVDTGLTVNVTSTSTVGNPSGSYKFASSTVAVSVSAGDKIGFSVTAGTDGEIGPDGAASWTFVPDNDNVYPVFFNGLVPKSLPTATTTTETYTVIVNSGSSLVGDAYSLRDIRSGCPSCGSLLYDGDQPFTEVKFDV